MTNLDHARAFLHPPIDGHQLSNHGITPLPTDLTIHQSRSANSDSLTASLSN